MTTANTDFGVVAGDLQRAATSFALLTSSATLFGSALSSFRDFERQLTLTNAIAQGTVEQFDRMKDAAREFALATTVTAVEAGQALQNLAQAGFSAEESLQAMNGVLLLSQATLSDVALSADTLSSNIRAFGLDAADTVRVANVFTAAITSSLATIDKLAFAFRQVAPVAELAGLSIEETTAALGVLFNVGLRGEQAGTALRNIIIRLIRPLGEASDLLEQAGIATRTTTGDLRNLADILRDIGASDLSDADLARIFETEALAGVKAFITALEDIDETGSDAYERLRDNITNTDRALEIAAKNLDTFDGQIGLLRNSLTDFGISIGENLAEPIGQAAEFVRGLLDQFRALDPEIRQQITSTLGWGAALLTATAAVNAILLIIRGPLLATMGKLLLLIGKPFVTALKAATVGLAAWAAAFGTAGGAAITFTGVLGGLLAATKAATVAVVAFLSTPVGAGLALITAGVAALSAAFVLATKDAREASAAFEAAFNADFARQLEVNASIADSIIPQSEVREVGNRIEQLENQLQLLELQTNTKDVVGTSNRKIGEIAILQSDIDAGIKELEEKFDSVAELDQQAQALRAAYDEAVAVFGEGSDQADSAFDGLNEFLATLNANDAAALATLQSSRAVADNQIDQLATVAGGFFDRREDVISDLLVALGSGEDTGLPENLDAAAFALAGELDTSAAFVGALAEKIAERAAEGGDVNLIVLEEALRSIGFRVEELVPLLQTYQAEQQNAIIGSLQSLVTENDAVYNEAYQKLLENEVATATSVADAVRAATELANAELEDNLAEIADELRGQFDETLAQFGELRSAAVLEAFDAAAAAQEDLSGDPTLGQLVSGQALLDAINSHISADSTPEEINAIIDEQFEIFSKLMEDFANALIEAGTIPPSFIAAIQAAFFSSAEAAKAAAEAGLAGVEATVASAERSATSRIGRSSGGGRSRGGGGGGGGKSAEQLAKEALRDARKIEDAFAQAAKQVTDAKVTFAENAFGLAPGARAETLLGLDIEEIEQDFDKQIQKLQRKLEDLELDFKGSPQQLADLKAQTQEAIRLTELAKQAEIDAATSFEAQMERRSEALDIFIRDLKTLAFESESTFTKVAAGIGVAFAEYNKDLVTLVDITSNAVTGFLDAVTTGIGDFIFDNENAWENFKANMLNISREIFEGFTKALLQQTISSLTDGGGSIFGNIFQPSAVGGDANSETPSVGTGGLLGGLFGGAGGQQQGQTGINAQPIQAGVQQVSQALTQGATQIQSAVQQLSSATSQGGAQQRSASNQAANQTRSGGQQVGQSFQQAGQTIGQAAGQAASTIQAGAAGGGGGSFLGSLLTTGLGFLGFAEGGMVSDRPINNFIRNYAEGGQITGPGTGTSDDILAFLSNGEFVVNAKATSEFQPLLEAINSGALKGDTAQMLLSAFRDGGRVNSRDALPAFNQGGLVGSNSFGAPAVDLTIPRSVIIPSGRTTASNPTVNNNTRSGDTININVNYTENISTSGDSVGSRRGRKSADQLAKRIGSQIERSRKNT